MTGWSNTNYGLTAKQIQDAARASAYAPAIGWLHMPADGSVFSPVCPNCGSPHCCSEIQDRSVHCTDCGHVRFDSHNYTQPIVGEITSRDDWKETDATYAPEMNDEALADAEANAVGDKALAENIEKLAEDEGQPGMPVTSFNLSSDMNEDNPLLLE